MMGKAFWRQEHRHFPSAPLWFLANCLYEEQQKRNWWSGERELTCDSQGHGSRDWNSIPCGPGNGTKFGILERLCLLHFWRNTNFIEKIFPYGWWNSMLSEATTLFAASTLIWKENDRAWNGITNIMQEKEARTMPSAHKTMGTDFWDAEGCIVIEFMPQGDTISAACYFQMLQKLCHALCDRYSATWQCTAPHS